MYTQATLATYAQATVAFPPDVPKTGTSSDHLRLTAGRTVTEVGPHVTTRVEVVGTDAIAAVADSMPQPRPTTTTPYPSQTTVTMTTTT